MTFNPSHWDHLSDAQFRALLALSFAVPIHQTYLSKKFKIRPQTLSSMRNSANGNLVRLVYLYDSNYPSSISGMPFYTLTQQGEAMQRNYLNWQRRVNNQIESLIGRKVVEVN